VLLQPEIGLIVLAAVAPAIAAGAILLLVARPSGREWAGALVAFTWGAVVATSVASVANDAAGARLPELLGVPRATFVTSALVGPAIEELVKAAGFLAVALVAGGVVRTMRGAVATGAAIGFGFAVGENASYYLLAAVQGGWEGLGRSVYLRGIVQGGNHAAFTAVVGAAIGWSSGRRRPLVVAIGLAVAIALHALWNGVVSHGIFAVLCNAPDGAACAPSPDPTDLLFAVPAIEAAFLLPILAGLGWLVRRAS
jgi:RsiW-degrading membrane proteinase PrsW (M82 family)